MSKGYGKFGGNERVNASYSSVPATECIGAGRLEGWFATEAFMADKRGWGHVQSFCFEGDLFFHLQRSPLCRGLNFLKKDPVTFEVIEVNGRCEAVKIMTPQQVEEQEAGGIPLAAADAGKADPKDLVGQRFEGAVQSQYQLMLKQKWGFVTSEAFAGKVFWHITENPDMQEVEFEREDVVEFDIVLDEERGSQPRAKFMKWIRPKRNPIMRPRHVSNKKERKREELMKNWRKGPPPDWDCKSCGFHNFGRNKTCKNCGSGTRPPREEWAPEEEDNQPEHQPMVIPPPYMKGDDPVTRPGWKPETWVTDAPSTQEVQASFSAPDRKFPTSWKDALQQDAAWQSHSSGGQHVSPSSSPFSQFPSDGSMQGKLALLTSTFNDVMETHDPVRTGESMVFRMRALMQEVNEVLGTDRSAKHAFSMELAKHPWFEANGYEVRYQPSRNRLGISAKNNTDAADDGAWGPDAGAPQKRKADDDWGW